MKTSKITQKGGAFQESTTSVSGSFKVGYTEKWYFSDFSATSNYSVSLGSPESSSSTFNGVEAAGDIGRNAIKAADYCVNLL